MIKYKRCHLSLFLFIYKLTVINFKYVIFILKLKLNSLFIDYIY